MSQPTDKAAEALVRLDARDRDENARIDKQKRCTHYRVTKTIVGGVTCNDCHIYLFKDPNATRT